MDIPTGFQNLTGLAVADFNGDGRPDIAVTDSHGKSIVVYLNNGSGSFQTQVTTTLNIPNTTGTILVGDFNEDGKQDLIVGTISGGSQDDIFLAGNGDGTFTQGAALPGSFGVISGRVVDLNHDSHLDLLEGDNGQLYVYLGDGHGNFTQQSFANQGSGDSYLAIDAGDFNNDGQIDLIAAGAISKTVSFYSGHGDGTFANASVIPPFVTAQQPSNSTILSIASGDFNNDGKRDLAVGIETGIAEVFLGNGDGTLQTTPYPLYLSATGALNPAAPVLAAYDMNNDGRMDLVTADNGLGSINVYLNHGTSTLTQTPDFTVTLPIGSDNLMTADLNSDGLPDIVVTNYKTGNISIFLSSE